VDDCVCDSGFYSGLDCGNWTCDGYGRAHADACAGRGTCVDVDSCICDNPGLYGSNLCEQWFCGPFLSEDLYSVCGGNGFCRINIGTNSTHCECNGRYEGLFCDDFRCFDVFPNDTDNACYGHGICANPNDCVCQPGYALPDCESAICGGVKSNSPSVCFGHGECGGNPTKPFECLCAFAFSGTDCETVDSLTLTLVRDWYVWFLILPLGVVFACSICWIAIYVVVRKILGQRKKLKVFAELDDIELLIEEQKVNKDSSVAHLRITKDLFQINYKDLKLLKAIGAGGSGTSIYLCKLF